jgi:hypothetical protein
MRQTNKLTNYEREEEKIWKVHTTELSIANKMEAFIDQHFTGIYQ